MNYVGKINYSYLGTLIGVKLAVHRKEFLKDVCAELLVVADKIAIDIKNKDPHSSPKLSDRPDNTRINDVFRVFNFRYISVKSGHQIGSITPSNIYPRHVIVFNSYENEVFEIIKKYKPENK